MEEMKQSGVQWIGEIPASWNTKRIKYMATLKGRIGWQGLTSDEYQDEGAFLITGVDFSDGGIDWENCVHVPLKRWEEAKDIQIQNGDLLITKDGTIGKVAIVSDMPGETSLNSGVLRIMPAEGYSNRFLYWVLQSDVFWNWFNYKNAGNSTIQHLYQGDFAEFTYAFPSYHIQEAIADFLDNHCSNIDCIISDLEHQLHVLENYKKSLIAESVSGHQLATQNTKDSGIPWVGKIPSHWKLSRLRYVAKLCSGATPSKAIDDFWAGSIPWVSSQEVKTNIIFDTSLHISESAVKSCSTQLMPAGTLVMVVRSGILQHTIPVALLGVPATINQDIKAFTFSQDINPAYYKYYIQGYNDALLIALVKDKTTVESIDNELLLSSKILVPPIEEQNAIVKYIDEQCMLIDEIYKAKSAQLECLRHHKASLIYEYVTGKKRVKEVQ